MLINSKTILKPLYKKQTNRECDTLLFIDTLGVAAGMGWGPPFPGPCRTGLPVVSWGTAPPWIGPYECWVGHPCSSGCPWWEAGRTRQPSWAPGPCHRRPGFLPCWRSYRGGHALFRQVAGSGPSPPCSKLGYTPPPVVFSKLTRLF